jgi:uncharacterized protein YndB with AHSA1/START domain
MKEADRPRVVLERMLPVPPAAVFRAWTDPASLRIFMCPGTFTSAIVEADVRVGGRFRIVMCEPERQVEHTGEYRAVDPPRRLVFTWHSPVTGPGGSLVTIELSPQAGGTRLVLTHEQLPSDDIAARHDQGWTSILGKLERHLGTAGGGTTST